MHRIDNAYRVVDKFGAGQDGFTEGAPGITAPTGVTDDWLDGVQEEICNVIEGNGGTLVKGTRNQLLAAIRNPVGAAGSGSAIIATGGAPDGSAIEATGDGTGKGIVCTGGHTGAAGLWATGTVNNPGATFWGHGTANGIVCNSGSSATVSAGVVGNGTGTNDNGVNGNGNGTGYGIGGNGGSSGAGCVGVGGVGGASGSGGFFQGAGASAGAQGTGGATGAGVYGLGGATSGAGVWGSGGATGGVGVLGAGTGGFAGGSFTGNAAGSGIAATGGATSGRGVSALGGAPNGIGVHSTGDGSGYGVYGVGGDASGVGVGGIGGATNGVGGHFTGTGTGTGCYGLGTNGHGVQAESDTTSPARSALAIVPQDTEGSVPAAGNIQVITTNGKIVNYNGTEWEKQVPQVHSIVVDEAESGGTGTPEVFATSKYTVPAGTLRQGSTIRVRASGTVVNNTHVVTIGVGLDTLHLDNNTITASNDDFQIDAFFTVRGNPGASVAVYGSCTTSTAGLSDVDAQNANLNTNNALDVQVLFTVAGATNAVTLSQFIVDVT